MFLESRIFGENAGECEIQHLSDGTRSGPGPGASSRRSSIAGRDWIWGYLTLTEVLLRGFLPGLTGTDLQTQQAGRMAFCSTGLHRFIPRTPQYQVVFPLNCIAGAFIRPPICGAEFFEFYAGLWESGGVFFGSQLGLAFVDELFSRESISRKEWSFVLIYTRGADMLVQIIFFPFLM